MFSNKNVAHTVLEYAAKDLIRANESIFSVEYELPEESVQRAALFRMRVSINKALEELRKNSDSIGYFWGKCGIDPILPGKEQET